MSRQAPPENPGSPSPRLRQASRRSTFAVSTSGMGNGGSIGAGCSVWSVSSSGSIG